MSQMNALELSGNAENSSATDQNSTTPNQREDDSENGQMGSAEQDDGWKTVTKGGRRKRDG